MTRPFIIESDFVTRQTPESRFSHFDGPGGWAEVVARTVADFDRQTPGYRDGVVLVPLTDTSGFYSGVATLKAGDKLVGVYEARREGEEPRKSTSVVGATKLPAKHVDVVLYRADVLAEDPNHVGKGEWEIVSVNCNPVEGSMPIEPMVLLHNHFGSTGGTATGMSDSELVAQLRESFEFWKDKAFVEAG
jgi:hypothetical protein